MPLHSAVKSGYIHAVKTLIDADANLDSTDVLNGRTPLLEAAVLGYPDIVYTLLFLGASSGVKDDPGLSFLHCAVKGGNIEILDLALETCKNVLETDKLGKIPLHIAAENGVTEAISRMLKVEDALLQVETKDLKERTALHFAAKSGIVEAIKLFLTYGSDINTTDVQNWTALHIAINERRWGAASYLIEKGADANICDSQGRTPIFIACEAHNEETVKLLIPLTQDLSAVDESEESILHIASRNGMLGVVADLIERGLDINACNDAKCSPIIIAAAGNHIDVVNLFLDASADVKCVSDEGPTALTHAVRVGNGEIVTTLLEAGANPNLEESSWPAVYTAAYWTQVEILQDLIRRGLDIERPGANNWTPLHAGHDDVKITHTLLEAGANSDAVTNDGRTVLHLTAQGYLETTKILLEKGLDPLAKDNWGRTPLHIAVLRIDTRRTAIVDMILEKLGEDANINVEDQDGLTPLQLAINGGNIDAVKLLLKRKNSSIDLRNGQDENLLKRPIEDKHLEMLDVLLRHGAVIQSSSGERLMRAAALEGAFAFVQTLLSQSIDPNAADEHGWTPEMYARQKGNYAVIEVLHDASEDENQRRVAEPLSPSCLSESVKSTLLDLDETKLVVSYTQKPTGRYHIELTEIACILADHPISILKSTFYYEIEVLEPGFRK